MKNLLYLFFAACLAVGMMSCNTDGADAAAKAAEEAAAAAAAAAEAAAEAAAAQADSLKVGMDSLANDVNDALDGLEDEKDGE